MKLCARVFNDFIILYMICNKETLKSEIFYLNPSVWDINAAAGIIIFTNVNFKLTIHNQIYQQPNK